MSLLDPQATLDRTMETLRKEADDDYLDECMPAGPVPENLMELFTACRSRALELHEVYPPSDDTLLMIERGEELLDKILQASSRDAGSQEEARQVNVVEVGSGSGMISAALLRSLGLRLRSGCESTATRTSTPCVSFYATDKNPLAVQCTKDSFDFVFRRGELANVEAGVRYSCLQSNFADALVSDLAGKVDLLIFNPPYVVTDDPEEMEGDGISISWAGGTAGREVIDRFLPNVAQLLRPAKSCAAAGETSASPKLQAGSLLMCGIFENDPHGLIEKAKTFGLVGELVDDRVRGEEHLWAIRFERSP
eukprot:TRINITY_DN17406_c0_g1_i1.p1 TRINITY_DN17406_c0_g1~~TRINITY_DN17406_c0_g1_i1.p1  ORF type:complete len:330 (+),score=72.68 TRINITY_DN17406_c0_g1_i1:68-991(+)